MGEIIISNVIGTAIPKPEPDQNTDDILPARFLREITFTDMGLFVYFDERFRDGDPAKVVQAHPFNDLKYRGASILIAGANYGCGSSREHAPQGLKRYGINAIIAPSFAEIFAGNCASLGIVGVTVPEQDLSGLLMGARQGDTAFDIDLTEKLIKYGLKEKLAFDIPEGRRQAFLGGTWDAMAVLQRDQAGIKRTGAGLEYLSYQ